MGNITWGVHPPSPTPAGSHISSLSGAYIPKGYITINRHTQVQLCNILLLHEATERGTSVSSTGSRKGNRADTKAAADLHASRSQVGSCASRSRQLCHVDLLRWHHPRRPLHLRGISYPSVGCVERRSRNRTGNQARTGSSSHQLSVHARCCHPPASLARTAATRTSAEALESRIPDRDLPRYRLRVQTHSRTVRRCLAQNEAA